MTDRSPTTFNSALSEEQFQPRKQVLLTTPDNVADNQQFFLEKNDIVISDCFCPLAFTAESYTTYRTYHVMGPHLCGLDSLVDVSFSCLAWSVTEDFSIRLYNNTTAAEPVVKSITSSHSSQNWRDAGGLATASNVLASDGTEQELQLQVIRNTSGGSDTCYVAGVFLFAGT